MAQTPTKQITTLDSNDLLFDSLPHQATHIFIIGNIVLPILRISMCKTYVCSMHVNQYFGTLVKKFYVLDTHV